MKLVISALFGGVVGALLVWLFQGNSIRLAPEGMSYADLSATMLGAVGILLTILGLVIAVLALWGYSQFKTMVEASAINHVKSSIESGELKVLVTETSVQFLKTDLDTGELRQIFERRLDEILVRGPSARAGEEAGAEPDTEFEEEPRQ